MPFEEFASLLEVQSLEKQIKKHLDLIDEHKNRIVFLNKNRNLKIEDAKELEEEIKQKHQKLSEQEKELFDLQTKLEKSKEHIPLATSEQQVKALEKEIETLSPKTEELETQTLELMEKIEEEELKLTELQEFIQGSEEGIQEIQKEVDQDVQKEELEIARYEERTKLLLEKLPSHYIEVFEQAQSKHRFNSPLTFMTTTSCQTCRYQIDNVSRNNIEKGVSVELCPGCGRLLTPLSARS